jgi:hypothetical protein
VGRVTVPVRADEGTSTAAVGWAYQAWVLPQCGQPTDVDTCASNTNPQLQL